MQPKEDGGVVTTGCDSTSVMALKYTDSVPAIQQQNKGVSIHAHLGKLSVVNFGMGYFKSEPGEGHCNFNFYAEGGLTPECVGTPTVSYTSAKECFQLNVSAGYPGDNWIYATIECGKSTCFPADATVTRADGRTARLDEIELGDEIAAFTPEGLPTIDTVSVFSLGQRSVSATFVSLETHSHLGRKGLSLTPDHHLPVGASCCSNLAMAKSLQVGDTVWLAAADGRPTAQTISHISLTVQDGLFNPLLTHGSMPIVDGFVTSFNSMEVVRMDSIAVPWLESVCSSTGTCTAVRRAVTAVECIWKHIRYSVVQGEMAPPASTLCKSFEFIDGVVCHAGHCTAGRDAARFAGEPHVRSAESCRDAAA